MNYDVVVVGAGPGGLIAARDLARAGFSVGVYDRNELGNLGKTIILEVEKSIFDRVGLAAPAPDEIPYEGTCMRWFSPSGREIFDERRLPCVAVFLDKLVKRMAKEAVKAGAKIHPGHTAVAPIVQHDRVCGVKFETRNTRKEVGATLVIDASGFDAVLARQLDFLGIEFDDHPSDVVDGANWYHEIDEQKAKEALSDGRCGDEEIWVNGAKGGNYSTEFYHLSLEKKRAYLLIGLKAEYGADFDRRYEDFLREKGYYGKFLYGGKARIRIRHSLPRLVTGGFMLVGEAACMVIPAHGSGVASALWAGRLAAQTAASALKRQDVSTEALWPYARQYQSDRGAILAQYSLLRFFLDSINPDRFCRMIEQGFVQGEDYYHSAIPESPAVSPSGLPGRLRGIIKNPGLIGPLVRTFWAMTRIKALYENYPSRYDPVEFRKWREKERALFAPFMPGR